MIPSATGGPGFIQRGTVTLAGPAVVPYTSLWVAAGSIVPAPDAGSAAASVLQDYQDGDVTYDFDPLMSLSRYDEVYIAIRNFTTDGSAAPGIKVRFRWTDGSAVGLQFHEIAVDNGLYGQVPPAAGAGDNTGLLAGGKLSHQAANIRQYVPSALEYFPIESGTGRIFPLRVKHALLGVGIAAIAPTNKQLVVMQLVPRTIGTALAG